MRVHDKMLVVGAVLALALSATENLALAQQTSVTTEVTVTTEQLYNSPEMEVGTSSEKQYAGISEKTPEERYEEFLSEMEMSDGVNFRESGSMFFVAYADARVSQAKKGQWVQIRNIAYSTAILNAKALIADYVATEIGSERASEVLEFGGDVAPPATEKAVKQLSVMDKALALTDRALDAEIKKFDPSWDGTGKTEDERHQRMVTMQEQYKSTLAARSRLFLSGALPILNIEGNDIDGNYVVGVAIVWSPRTQLVASAITSDAVQLPLDTPEPPIRQQLQNILKSNPNFLAVSQGVRIWTNEKGEQTVISFSSVDRKKNKQLNNRKAGANARKMIGQFVAEMVVTADQASEQLTVQTLANGEEETFNESSTNTLVEAKARTIKLTGVAKVYSWKGKHPETNANIQVDVYAWTPLSRGLAQGLQQMSNEQQQQMNKQGVSPGIQSTETNTVGATTRSGATTKKNKW